MSNKIRVVAGVFCRADTVLVQERPAHKARGGLWEFPGGKVEPGETYAQALARECVEELGVTVRVGEELFRAEHAYIDVTVELIVLRAFMDEDAAPVPHDAARLAWVPRASLSQLPFCEADLPLIARLASGELTP